MHLPDGHGVQLQFGPVALMFTFLSRFCGWLDLEAESDMRDTLRFASARRSLQVKEVVGFTLFCFIRNTAKLLRLTFLFRISGRNLLHCLSLKTKSNVLDAFQTTVQAATRFRPLSFS